VYQDWRISSIGWNFEVQFFGGSVFGGRKSAKEERKREKSAAFTHSHRRPRIKLKSRTHLLLAWNLSMMSSQAWKE
jgi:hypothetical protein